MMMMILISLDSDDESSSMMLILISLDDDDDVDEFPSLPKKCNQFVRSWTRDRFHSKIFLKIGQKNMKNNCS